MILIDSNVFMYAAGEAHANKMASVRLLERVARREIDAFIDAEVLQEILHRYRSIDRWKQGAIVYDLTRSLIVVVTPVTVEVVDRAREILETYPRLTARDALHASSSLLMGNGQICNFDRDFDGLEGITRLEPSSVS